MVHFNSVFKLMWVEFFTGFSPMTFEVILPKLESFQSFFLWVLSSPTHFPSETLMTWKLDLMLQSHRSWGSVHFLLLCYPYHSPWVISIILYAISRQPPFGSILILRPSSKFFILVIYFSVLDFPLGSFFKFF